MRTKIIATIGPASCGRDTLAQLANAGVSVFRLNFSHGDVAFFQQLVKDIRSVEKERGLPLTIMQDLSGPKIRIGKLEGDAIEVSKGVRVLLGAQAPQKSDMPFIPFEHQRLIDDIVPDDLLVLADGGLRFRAREKTADGLVILEALGSGIITSRKGLALPGKALPLPALTEKDRKDLEVGLGLGVDAVALSFVQTAEDIRQAKALIRALGSQVPLVAKLERQSAVDNLDAILKETDMVMVARGDLGVECPLPQLPSLQKRIIKACNEAAKPVIVATQMLLSMVNSPAPTRAETTDVANAVLDGADCVMLSEETAMGNYPVETVGYMRKITGEAEEYLLTSRRNRHVAEPGPNNGPAEFLAYAACLLADKTGAAQLVSHSRSGSSARLLSSRRPRQPIHALSPDPCVLHALNFAWGVQPHHVAEDPEVPHSIRVQRFIATNPLFAVGDPVVFTAGESQPGQENPGTNLVKIYRK